MSDNEDNLFVDNDLEIIDENDANLESNIQETNEETAQNGENEAEEETKKVKAEKKIVRHPRVLLKEEHLNGAKGLSVLPTHFEEVKYKGRGCEDQDLNVILKKYQHWCHRLFPKMPFDDCLARIEWLGKRKTLKTYIKKIRMDLEDSGTISNPVLSEEEPVDDERVEEPVEINEEMLERMRGNREKAERIRMERLRQQEVESNEMFESSETIVSVDVHRENEEASEIDEEMLERVRVNREKAEEIRRERLRQQEIELSKENLFLAENVGENKDEGMDNIEMVSESGETVES